MYSFKRRIDSSTGMLPKFDNAAVDPFSAQKVGTSDASTPATRAPIDLQVVLLVVVWYFCAVVTITTTKEVMNRVRLPYLLCLSQFAFASVLSFGFLQYTEKLKAIPPAVQGVIVQIAASYTLGFILTNIAFSLGTASSVETVKAGEPFTTVLLGLILLKESYSRSTYLSLVPICGGVALACYSGETLNMWSFSLAMASNFCFSARSVYTKVLNSTHAHSFDEINLFYAISWIGLIILLPIMAVMEGPDLLAIVSGAHGKYHDIDFYSVIVLLCMNGAMFAVYNLASYAVLKRTELVTHSVLNVFRRVFIIGFTCMYFHIELSFVSIVGISIATVGVLLFSMFRKAEKAAVRP